MRELRDGCWEGVRDSDIYTGPHGGSGKASSCGSLFVIPTEDELFMSTNHKTKSKSPF